LTPPKIASQLDISEGADVVIGNHVLVYFVDGKVTKHIKYANPKPWEGLIESNLGITSSILWKRQTLLNVGGWDSSLTSSQEYNLLFSLLKAGAKFVYQHEVQTNINKSDSSISKSGDKFRLEQIVRNRIDLRVSIRTYLQGKGMLNRHLGRLIDTYIYNELMTWINILPEFTDQFLKNNSLDVSKMFVLKTQMKRLLKFD